MEHLGEQKSPLHGRCWEISNKKKSEIDSIEAYELGLLDFIDGNWETARELLDLSYALDRIRSLVTEEMVIELNRESPIDEKVKALQAEIDCKTDELHTEKHHVSELCDEIDRLKNVLAGMGKTHIPKPAPQVIITCDIPTYAMVLHHELNAAGYGDLGIDVEEATVSIGGSNPTVDWTLKGIKEFIKKVNDEWCFEEIPTAEGFNLR